MTALFQRIYIKITNVDQYSQKGEFMIFKLDTTVSPNPIGPWRSVFMSLSINQFTQFYEEFNFPFNPSESLQNIAHDFALTLEITRRSSDYAHAVENLLRHSEVVSIDLLEGVEPHDTYIKRCEILFTNTFKYLTRMHYANEVFSWGKQTQDYSSFADVKAVHAWYELLRKWAILEQLSHPISTAHALYSSDWDDVIIRWSRFYGKATVKPLNLAEASELQAIILSQETRRMHLEITLDQAKASPRNLWEDYVLHAGTAGGTWIKQEGDFRIGLRVWDMIIKGFSSEEIHTLEEWALQYQDQYPNLKIPFPGIHSHNSNQSNKD